MRCDSVEVGLSMLRRLRANQVCRVQRVPGPYSQYQLDLSLVWTSTITGHNRLKFHKVNLKITDSFRDTEVEVILSDAQSQNLYRINGIRRCVWAPRIPVAN